MRKARYWAGFHCQYTGPGGTSSLAERGVRISGCWKFTYVPLQRLIIQRKPIETPGWACPCPLCPAVYVDCAAEGVSLY